MHQALEHAGKRIAGEAKKAFRLTIYFGVWFSAITLLTHEILKGEGLPYGSWGLAWIKAALCAKFVLLGEALYPMRHATGANLWRIVLPRSAVYLIVVVALSVLEKAVEGVVHGRPFMDGLQAFADGNCAYFLALTWVYWLILLPYLVLEALEKMLKEGEIP